MSLHDPDTPADPAADLPRPPRPMLLELEEESPEADPSSADALPDLAPSGAAMQGAARFAVRRGSALGRLARWVFGALFSLVASVTAWNFVTGLFAQNSVLGWVAFALFVAALALVVLLALREWAAYARMARLDGLRKAAEAARAKGDLAAAKAVVAKLVRLYAHRGETAWGRAKLAERQAEVFDADALLALAEVELLTPLDQAALAEVEAAARQVATVTALVPLALADVATALFANLRMIRRLSEIYGGRSGSFGSFRLMRRVFVALLGAGALALTDDLLGSFASGGVLSKLSRRFGEGVVNGALTARVGLAAMELCRPLPFAARAKPGVSATTSRALAGLMGRG